jgi:hypothetical protein
MAAAASRWPITLLLSTGRPSRQRFLLLSYSPGNSFPSLVGPNPNPRVRSTSTFTLKDHSTTRNQLPVKTHEEN